MSFLPSPKDVYKKIGDLLFGDGCYAYAPRFVKLGDKNGEKFANKKILKNMYNSIKNVKMPSKENNLEKKDFVKASKVILPKISQITKIINVIAGKPSSFKWRLKKFFSSDRGSITLGELFTSKKKAQNDIIKELKSNVEKLKNFFQDIITELGKYNFRDFQGIDKEKVPKMDDTNYIYSFHLIRKNIVDLCNSSIANLDKVFTGYPNKITKINYQNLLGTQEAKKYTALEQKANEELKKMEEAVRKNSVTEKPQNPASSDIKPFQTPKEQTSSPLQENLNSKSAGLDAEVRKELEDHYDEYVVYDSNIKIGLVKNIFDSDKEKKLIQAPVSCKAVAICEITNIKQYNHTGLLKAKYVLLDKANPKKSGGEMLNVLYEFGEKEQDVIDTIKKWFENGIRLDTGKKILKQNAKQK